MIHAQELRGEDGADRSRIYPGETVTADFAVHGAVIQARPTPDAIERFTLFAVGQYFGAAIIEKDDVKLFRSVNFTITTWTRQKRGVNGQGLAGGTAPEQFQKHRQILRARDELLDAGDGNVNLGSRCCERSEERR